MREIAVFGGTAHCDSSGVRATCDIRLRVSLVCPFPLLPGHRRIVLRRIRRPSIGFVIGAAVGSGYVVSPGLETASRVVRAGQQLPG